jgi:hypothetical protein
MKKHLKVLIIFLAILPFIMIGTDYSLAQANKSPIFSVRTAIYKDGGTKTYVGLGYKIINYNELDGRKDVEFIPFFAANESSTSEQTMNVTDEMDRVISEFIIDYNKDQFFETEKQFEVHKVYGTKETDGIIEVYIYSLYMGFNRGTKDQEQSGRSGPALIKLKKEKDTYSVIEYIEPEDGEMYVESIYEMFPKSYAKKAISDTGYVNQLDAEIKKKVAKWLEEDK